MKVEIWSDVVCPWCAIGRERFWSAVREFAHGDELEVTWRSFELDPQAPRERTVGQAEHLAEKYGTTVERACEMQANVTQAAAAEGLDFHFERARSGNTFDAH